MTFERQLEKRRRYDELIPIVKKLNDLIEDAHKNGYPIQFEIGIVNDCIKIMPTFSPLSLRGPVPTVQESD